MTSVGWVGLGKLGAPCAAALAANAGVHMWGYDVRGVDPNNYTWEDQPPIELCDSIGKVVAETDNVVFVAVQTPHSPEYGGETIVPEEPRDFEYAYLINAVREVCVAAAHAMKHITLVVVSTVLPGTFDRHLRPLLNYYVTPVYHPFFIAMGTVVQDFITPEMTLFGADDPTSPRRVLDLYELIHKAPAPIMSIASAELTKVAYNTFISMKIVYTNALAEMCDATGADADEVIGALVQAKDRIISPKYLRAGMGDGGGCHPRDNVALSALAQQHKLSVDLMGFLTRAREAQTGRLADLVQRWVDLTSLPATVLGQTYKPNVALTDGSPALLLLELLHDRGVRADSVDPLIHGVYKLIRPGVYVIGTAHDVFTTYQWPVGSVVIDPFGMIGPQSGVTLVTPGRKR